MKKIYNYNSYLSCLRAGKTDVVFSGEWSVLKLLNKYKPQGVFFVWDMLDEMGNAILLQVNAGHDSINITHAYVLVISAHKIAENLDISESEMSSAIKWWNVCYYRDQEGNVVYDEYYDKLFAADNTKLTMSDFREELQKHIGIIPKEISGNNVYVLGDLATFNPLIYELQKLDCQVTSVSAEDWGESEDLEERLLHLRDEMVVPYCNGEVYKMKRITSEGTIEVQAECKHPYVISLPCDDLDLNANVIGNYTLKKILPNGEIHVDYKCCGKEFMYLEQILYADLFGNTVLKNMNVTSSQSVVLHEAMINSI